VAWQFPDQPHVQAGVPHSCANPNAGNRVKTRADAPAYWVAFVPNPRASSKGEDWHGGQRPDCSPLALQGVKTPQVMPERSATRPCSAAQELQPMHDLFCQPGPTVKFGIRSYDFSSRITVNSRSQ
jgi:hypothetical protein